MCRDEKLNERDNDDERQPGGVSMITNGRATEHVIGQGGDARGLGRWYWVTFKGKKHKKTCIIGTYRAGMGWMTNDNQLSVIRGSEEGAKKLLDPIKVWFDDLKYLVRQKQKEGCQIIIAGDFNDTLKSDKGKVNKLMYELNLEEAIMKKYGKNKAPNTFSLGKNTIDGIYASMGMTIEQGG